MYAFPSDAFGWCSKSVVVVQYNLLLRWNWNFQFSYVYLYIAVLFTVCVTENSDTTTNLCHFILYQSLVDIHAFYSVVVLYTCNPLFRFPKTFWFKQNVRKNWNWQLILLFKTEKKKSPKFATFRSIIGFFLENIKRYIDFKNEFVKLHR